MLQSMTTTRQIEAIFHRHQPDADEAGRCCRSCGRPWPCDVNKLSMVFELDALTTDAIPNRDGIVRRSHSRRPAPLRTPVPA